jgi:ABC-type bacteriocin/lantibiotic exporter with double-glycine peptidase domain
MANFHFYKQESNCTCGAAVMRMALEFCDIKKSEQQIAKLLGTNNIRGTWHKSFPLAAEKFKLNYAVERNATINDLKKYQKDKYIVIVCYLYLPEKIDHYSIVKKIDEQYIYFHDPFFGVQHKYRLSYFNKIWKSLPQHDNEKSWFFAVKK